MKLKYIFIIFAALIAMTSCSDFLDKETDTRVTLTDAEQLRMLMASAYPSGNPALICEFSTDNYIDNNSPSARGIRYNLPSYGRNDDETFAWEDIRSESGSDSPSDLWSSYYSAIATCNAALDLVYKLEADGQNSDLLQAVKGEALIDRAFCHFMLANLFCMPYQGPEKSKEWPGIPYITEPETKVLVHYDRGTLQETYEKIERDIVDGLPLISDAIYEIPKYHFNKQAALAFAARFYLYKREYDKVLEYADAAFGGANVDPTPFLTDIWSKTTTLTSWVEGNRYFAGAERQRNFLIIPCYSVLVRHLAGGNRYAMNRESLNATLLGPGPSWEDCKGYYTSDANKESHWFHPALSSALWTNGGQEYGCYWGYAVGEHFEYTDKVAGIGYAHNIRTEFTGDELLLNRAEAKLFLGDIEGCYQDHNTWEISLRNCPVTMFTKYMEPLTKENIIDFYTRAEDAYVTLLGHEAEYGVIYQENIFFGIAKPIHIDEICPSSKYKLTEEKVPFLQCIQHFRRLQSIHNGLRWFDIKRYGISFSHKIGKESKIVTLQVNDPRYAFQIPNEIMAAGLDGNEREPQTPDNSASKISAKLEALPFNQ